MSRRLRQQRPRLGRYAEAAGFTNQSLSALTGIDSATLTRHWTARNWAASVKGQNLLKIAACVPGLMEAVLAEAMQQRLHAAVLDIEEAGFSLDETAVQAALANKIVPQFLYTGLTAVGKLLIRDTTGAENALRSCWGREQTRALDVVFGTHDEWHALVDSEPLISASREAFQDLAGRSGYSFGRCIALTHLAHHIGKATGELMARPTTGTAQSDWVAGFYVRGAFMGKLRHGEAGIELADEYHEVVHDNDNAEAVEKWAFPRWVGDVPPTDDFELPEHPMLKRTADEILHELDHYNETYVYYLAKTFIPLALNEMDSTFGGRRKEVAEALRRRAAVTENADVAQQLMDTGDLASEVEV